MCHDRGYHDHIRLGILFGFSHGLERFGSIGSNHVKQPFCKVLILLVKNFSLAQTL